MTPQELKNSILQLAIQGRLVEQRPEEGTAEELVKKIQAEKQALIKAGKLKKEKPLPPITDDEKPFEIPESWMWCYVGNIFDHNTGKAMNSSAKATNKKGAIRKFITTSNLYWNSFDFTSVKEMFFSDDELDRCTATKNDILMCEGGAYYGRTAIWNYDYDICFQNHIHRLRAYAPIVEQYFYYVFYFYRNNGMMLSKGTAMPGLSSVVLHNLILPLPPLAEQKRIVAKIEELLPLIDRYEKAWTRLEDFNKRFPDDMQKSILQMAIQGKLVEQRPEEGTAEDLYKQIQSEKQSLIKAGKIKKEKPLPPITDDETPFEIPSSWKWVRFSEIATFLNGDRGANYPNKDEYVSTGVAWINTGHITTDGYLDIDSMNYITEEKYESLRSGKIEIGDLVYCLRGATFGKVARIEPFSKGAVASSLMIIRLHIKGLREYIYTYLKSPIAYQQLHLYNNGSAQPNLAAKDVEKYLIPLPPLAEQKRIVAKIEELLPLCERLK